MALSVPSWNVNHLVKRRIKAVADMKRGAATKINQPTTPPVPSDSRNNVRGRDGTSTRSDEVSTVENSQFLNVWRRANMEKP